MDFNDILKKRRSIRKYTKEEVPIEKIKEMISYAMLAPSAKNRQPWKIKLAKKEEKNKISQILYTKRFEDCTIENTTNVIEEANKLLLVFLDNNNNNEQRKNDLLSIGAFIENMILKATELNLGTLWIANTDYINKNIKDLYGTNLECVSAIAIGYKNQEPKPRPRKDIKEIIM